MRGSGYTWPLGDQVSAVAQDHSLHKIVTGTLLKPIGGSRPPRTRTLRLTSATLPHLPANRFVNSVLYGKSAAHARRQLVTCRAEGR